MDVKDGSLQNFAEYFDKFAQTRDDNLQRAIETAMKELESSDKSENEQRKENEKSEFKKLLVFFYYLCDRS